MEKPIALEVDVKCPHCGSEFTHKALPHGTTEKDEYISIRIHKNALIEIPKSEYIPIPDLGHSRKMAKTSDELNQGEGSLFMGFDR